MINIIKRFIKRQRLKIGDRVKLFGGYRIPPEWLCGNEAYYGTVISFIKGPFKKLDAAVKLDKKITYANLSGDIIVLTLRYTDATWRKGEIVHIHLFDSLPDEKDWSNLNEEKWQATHVESHACYRIVAHNYDNIK